jgi:hypothetical protein
VKIGDEFDIWLIGFTGWHAFASARSANKERLMNRLRHLADALPNVIATAGHRDPCNAAYPARQKARRATLSGAVKTSPRSKSAALTSS